MTGSPAARAVTAEATTELEHNVEPDQLTGAALVNGQILCVDGGTVMPV